MVRLARRLSPRWGALARCCSELEVGDGLRLEGRLQSREYIKVEQGESSTRTAYEISALTAQCHQDTAT